MAADPRTEGERHSDQPYHVELVKSGDPGGNWTAQVEELPGCVAHGATAEEAARGVEAAINGWIDDAVRHGRDVPSPRVAASHSGRLLVRMPHTLHAELASAAERERISLNQFITGVLAGALQWRGQAGDPGAGETAPGRGQSPRATRRVLVANVLLLVLIAALAVALLVIGINRG
jgi:predicted RNase H-like HicB family nuclease